MAYGDNNGYVSRFKNEFVNIISILEKYITLLNPTLRRLFITALNSEIDLEMSFSSVNYNLYTYENGMSRSHSKSISESE